MSVEQIQFSADSSKLPEHLEFLQASDLMLIPPYEEEITDKHTLVEITGHRSLRVGGVTHELSETSARFFNTLLCSRNEYLTVKDLAQLHNFSIPLVVKTIQKLHTDLSAEDTHVVERVQQQGNNKPDLYRISHAIVFEDVRNTWHRHDFFTRRYIQYENDQPYIEQGKLMFKQKVNRVDFGATMLQTFADHPVIQRAVTQLLHDIDFQPPGYAQMQQEEEIRLFDAIEKAFIVFAQQGKAVFGQELATIHEGIIAFYTLYFRHTHAVTSFVRKARETGGMWQKDDLQQEASVALIEAIWRGRPEKEDNTFEMVLPRAIQNAVSAAWVQKVWSNGQRRGFTLYREYTQIKGEQERLLLKLGRSATHAEIADEIGWNESRVRNIVQEATSQPLYLNAQIKDTSNTYAEMLVEEEDYRQSFDFVLDHMVMQDDIENIFASDQLLDNEKVVLSILYGIYSEKLCGAELLAGRLDRNPRTFFTYPYDEETFTNIARDISAPQELDKFFNLNGFSIKHHRNGLKKARELLGDTDTIW